MYTPTNTLARFSNYIKIRLTKFLVNYTNKKINLIFFKELNEHEKKTKRRKIITELVSSPPSTFFYFRFIYSYD